MPQVLEKIQGLLTDQDTVQPAAPSIAVDDTPESQTAALLSDSLGTQENVQSVKDQGSTLIVQVNDPNLVDSVDVFKSLGIGVKDVQVTDKTVTITFSEMADIARQIMA